MRRKRKKGDRNRQEERDERGIRYVECSTIRNYELEE